MCEKKHSIICNKILMFVLVFLYCIFLIISGFHEKEKKNKKKEKEK